VEIPGGRLIPILKRSRGLTVRERFDGKWVLADGGCWLWTDEPAANGYGYLGVGGRAGRKIQAHRLAYELYIGPIPPGLDIDHLCRNRRCVNPWHLEAVDRRTNLLRGDTVTARHAAATRCPQGHPYDDRNTRVYRGKRQCRTCHGWRGL
jgi:hypothetical protein